MYPSKLFALLVPAVIAAPFTESNDALVKDDLNVLEPRKYDSLLYIEQAFPFIY